jgi:hypothetical protein
LSIRTETPSAPTRYLVMKTGQTEMTPNNGQPQLLSVVEPLPQGDGDYEPKCFEELLRS